MLIMLNTHCGPVVSLLLACFVCLSAFSQDIQPVLTLPTGGIRYLEFSSSVGHLIDANEVEVRNWDLDTAEIVYSVRFEEPYSVVTVSPDGRILAVGGDNKVRLYALQSGTHIRDLSLAYRPTALAFSPDVRRLLTGVPNRAAIEFFTVETGEKVDSFHLDDGNEILDLAFAPDGGRLLIGYLYGEQGLSFYWLYNRSALISLPDKEILASYGNRGDTAAYSPVDYSCDGALYALFHQAVCVYSARTFSIVTELPARAVILPGFAFSPDGTKLLYGPALHDARTGELLREFPTDPYDSKVAYSPDGSKVAIEDRGTVTIWDVSDLNTAVEDWPERESTVRAVDGVK